MRPARRAMAPDTRSLVRWTLGSALALGALFGGVAATRALATGASPLEHLGPVAAFGVIGATVGGLVGPLMRGVASRGRGG